MKKEDKNSKIRTPRLEKKIGDEHLLDPDDFWNDLPDQSNQPQKDNLDSSEIHEDSGQVEKSPDQEEKFEIASDDLIKSDLGPTPLDVDQLIPSAKPFRPIAKVYDKPKAKRMITAKPASSAKRLRILMVCFFAFLLIAILWMYVRFSLYQESKTDQGDHGDRHTRIKDESPDTKSDKLDAFDKPSKEEHPNQKQKKNQTLLGRLSLMSNPPGAVVYINGVRRGATPTQINDVSVGGKVEIKMEMEGYRTWKHEFMYDSKMIEREFVADLFKDIVCESGVGWLHVDSDPSGAIVKLDGKQLPGKTPMVVDQVCSGVEHKLRVFALGYRTWWRSFILKRGEVRTFRARMIR